MENEPSVHATPRLVYAWEGEVEGLHTEINRLRRRVEALEQVIYEELCTSMVHDAANRMMVETAHEAVERRFAHPGGK